MLLSDRILANNEDLLGRMLNHRMVADIKANRLPRAVFHRYLAHEGAFVHTAISIFAFALARAPDIGTQRRLIGVLDALANTQVPFFEDVLARLAITPPRDVPREVADFDRGMLALARDGGFVDIMTAMFAAEWMYWSWCRAASVCRIDDPDLKAWVDLHADKAFGEQATWLKDTIDSHGTPADAERLSALFARVTVLEIAFHSAPYNAGPNSAGPNNASHNTASQSGAPTGGSSQ